MPATHPATSLPNESARVELRNALATYFHAQPPAAPAGYPRWTAASAQPASPPQDKPLLVGDSVTLMVSPAPHTRKTDIQADLCFGGRGRKT
jgi:hypothetical protein